MKVYELLQQAKKHLTYERVDLGAEIYETKYICHAIEHVAGEAKSWFEYAVNHPCFIAGKAVQAELNGHDVYTNYLRNCTGIDPRMLTARELQEGRHALLVKLIKEFKEKNQ